MTSTATSKQTALCLFWACAGINVLVGVASLVRHDVIAGGWQFGAAGLIVTVSWVVQTAAARNAAVQRELDAKASFAELLLAKMRQTDGIALRMDVQVDDHEGTKH